MLRSTLFPVAAVALLGGAPDDLYRLDRLPALRPVVKVGSFSSYDRTGGNEDGFSGKYSFLRKEDDALVLAELNGPGVITRIWTATPNDSPLEFFFDGEASPRLTIPFRELFSGKRPPFLAPVAGSGAGGYYSYTPLEFQKSCKIRLRGPQMRFYQINYALYEPGAQVSTFDPDSPQLRARVIEAAKLWAGAGQEIAPAGAQRVRKRHTLEPGQSAMLFEAKRGGRVVGVKLSPASAFSGPDRAVVIRAEWDGEKTPAVLAPVSDFFGYSFGDPAARSLLVGTAGETSYIYFPMPFDRSARISIISERTAGPPVRFESEVLWSEEPRRADEGRFYAHWRRENPTVSGRPFTFVETNGCGHLVGVMLQAQGAEPGATLFFEGDDQATIDGELAIHGTGSEDFFNGGWYDVPGRWCGRVSLPLSGAMDYEKALARTAAYRFLLADAYSFRKSLRLTIEHGPEKNLIKADYTAVSFLYLMDAPSWAGTPLPAVAARAVVEPAKLVFVPGWQQPLYAFSMMNMTVGKRVEKIGGESVRVFSVDAKWRETFGPHYVAFSVKIPKAGEYEIALQALTGPEQGAVQLLVNDAPAGDEVSFTAAGRAVSEAKPLGTLRLDAGENHLFFRLGSAPEMKGRIRADLVRIHCTRR